MFYSDFKAHKMGMKIFQYKLIFKMYLTNDNENICLDFIRRPGN